VNSDRTLPRTVHTVPPDASVGDESLDLCVWRLTISNNLRLLALKDCYTQAVGLDVSDEIMKLANRAFRKPGVVLLFLRSVLQGRLK
jgi:hypothetical protein